MTWLCASLKYKRSLERSWYVHIVCWTQNKYWNGSVSSLLFLAPVLINDPDLIDTDLIDTWPDPSMLCWTQNKYWTRSLSLPADLSRPCVDKWPRSHWHHVDTWLMHDVLDTEQVAVLKGHSGLVKGVTWDPVGKYLASQVGTQLLLLSRAPAELGDHSVYAAVHWQMHSVWCEGCIVCDRVGLFLVGFFFLWPPTHGQPQAIIRGLNERLKLTFSQHNSGWCVCVMSRLHLLDSVRLWHLCILLL